MTDGTTIDGLAPGSPSLPEEGFPLKYFYIGTDGIIYENEYTVGPDCLKVDREMYKDKFEEVIRNLQNENPEFDHAVKSNDFNKVQIMVEENIMNRPEFYFTLESLKKAYNSDNNLIDYVKKSLGIINKLPDKFDRLNEEFERLKILQPIPYTKLYAVKEVFENYLLNPEYRGRVSHGDMTALYDPVLGGTINPETLTKEDIESIISYIKANRLTL